MPRRLARALLGFVVAAVALVGVLVVVPAAYAAPVANPDGYAVYSGGTYTLTPIDNDTKTFLSSGELSLCGVGTSDARLVYLEQVDDTIVAEVRRGASGTSTIDYDVCQGSRRATGRITLTITRTADLQAAKAAGVRGRVVFTNTNQVPVTVTYGSATSGKPDATRTVAASGSLTVATTRSSIYWVAQHLDNGVAVPAGDATLRSVQSRK